MKNDVTPLNSCPRCGEPLRPEARFCPRCGEKTAPAQRKRRAGKVWLIIGIVLTVVVVSLWGFGRIAGEALQSNFALMYADFAAEPWCSVSADGSCLKIDTDPQDLGAENQPEEYVQGVAFPAYHAIEQINADLGFSRAVWEKMMRTTASQGRLTESSGRYRVSWIYSVEKGLEVLYEVAN